MTCICTTRYLITQPEFHTDSKDLFSAQNNNSEVNQNGDGFFPSIFNEDDLNLMDMAITDCKFHIKCLKKQVQLILLLFP